MQKTCIKCLNVFEINDAELDFFKRMNLPLPDLCSQERMRQLMAFRNEWKLYPRKCDSSGKDILSAYAANSPFTIYANDIWWGDSWDATQYGQPYDFSKSFFNQFATLQLVVPREGTSVFNCENCDYNSHIRQSKNCYLNSLVAQCEDLYYSYWAVKDKDVFDSLYTNESTLCSWCNEVNNSYGCIVLEESKDCNSCYFSYQLRGCDHCLFCTNLANKSYCIKNKSCTKEEFETFKKKMFDGSWNSWQKTHAHYVDLKLKTPHRYVHNLNCENCTGDHLYHSKNLKNCFDGFNTEEASHSVSLGDSKNVYGIYSAGWPGCELIYNSVVSRGSQNIACCYYTWFSHDLRYCDSCVSCENCFGCIGLHHKKYCILNQQYSKEEYEKLLPKIIKHMEGIKEWGQFFPPALSPFAYNETAAQDFFPFEKSMAKKLGYRWREEDRREFKPSTLSTLPDNIKDVSNDIVKEILACETCKKNYRLILKELRFYQKENLPIPRECPACRHKRRFQNRNLFELFKRACNKCGTEIESTYSPSRPEQIFCEKCFLEEI